MSKMEVVFYLADEFKRKELLEDDQATLSDEYTDDDLNQSHNQEFWKEIKVNKVDPSRLKGNRKSASVSRAGGLETRTLDSTQGNGSSMMRNSGRNFGERRATGVTLPSINSNRGFDAGQIIKTA